MGLSIQKNRPRKRRPILLFTAFLVAAGLVSYAVWGLWQQYQATHEPQPTISHEVVTRSMDRPSETPPTVACSEYNASSDQPRKIQIKSLKIDACIERVGLDQDNSIAVPTNIHVAGYYVDSPIPGEPGVSIIDGHVLGRYRDAIFKDLEYIKPDAIIRIQRGDESWVEFSVVDVNSYRVDEAMKHLLMPLATELDEQLNLITCTGTYDTLNQTYDKRVVVRAMHITN